MKVMSPEALEALATGRAVVSGAVEFQTLTPFRRWGGYSEIEIDGETYLPLGDRGIVRASAGSVGSAAQGMTIELSGIPPTDIAQINTAQLRSVAVTCRRLIFDQHGLTLLDESVHERGRVDSVARNESGGGESKISVTVDGSVRGLGRRSGRMRTDADQRLILSTDGGRKHVSYAGDRTLYWGGKPPQRAGAAIPNAGSVGGGGGSGDVVARYAV